MKKLCVLSVAALALALLPQQASAWSNIKLGAGFNFHWQTGDNHIGKHIYHNGPVPHPYGHGFGHGPQVIVVDQSQGHQGNDGDEVKAPSVNQAQTVPMSPYHYSSFQGGHYYQEPGYYYGQNYWYGW
jgi:hypothetical protein